MTVQVIAGVIYQVAIHIQSPPKPENGSLQMCRGLQCNMSLAPPLNIFFFMTKSKRLIGTIKEIRSSISAKTVAQ
jgi:hypothetical protein